jgi:amino acid adenylation domain-containing protein
MNGYKIIIACRSQGIELSLKKGQISVLGLKPKLAPHKLLLTQIKQNKEQIIGALTKEAELSKGQGGVVKTFTASDFPWAKMSETLLNSDVVQSSKTENCYIATPMQVGFLFHGLDDHGASYVSNTHCDLVGKMDVDAFKRSWQYIVNRYSNFRTCFIGLDEPQIHQLVLKQATLGFIELDWRDQPAEQWPELLREYRAQDKAKGFDFAQPPLMRVSLIRLSDERYHFVWSHHHVLSDGWCLPIVFSEVIRSYKAFGNGTQPTLPKVVPYEHYIGWLSQQDMGQARTFWRQQLAGLTAPTPLMIDKLTGEPDEKGPEFAKIVLRDTLKQQLDTLAKTAPCTMNVIIQVAWSLLLQRYSGESEVVFGATVSGRPAQLPGIEKMVGLFINTLPVRVAFESGQSLVDLLKQVHGNNVSCDEYSYLGLGEIIGTSELPNGVSLFDSLIVYENYPTELGGQGMDDSVGLAVEAVGSGDQTNFGVLLNVFDEDELTLQVSYRLERFSRQTIERLMAQLQQILTNMAQGGAEQRVADIDVLPKAEKQLMLTQWNDAGAEYPKGLCIHNLLEQQAEQHPDNVAVICGSKQLTFAQLNHQSNQLAHHLLTLGVKPDTLIGLSIERSLALMVGLFGIMKAGAGYVPLDPGYPTARLEHMLADSNAQIIITQKSLLDVLPISDQQVLCVDDQPLMEALKGKAQSNPAVADLTPQNLAYVIYTSGSTGQPKGVLVEHHSVVNFLQYSADVFMPEHLMGSLVSAPLAFDGTVCTLYTPLLKGKYVEFLAAEDTAIDLLADYIFDDEEPLLFKLTPAHLEALLSQAGNKPNEDAEHVFVIAGDLLVERTLAKWRDELLPNATFYNEYGPTEATVGTTVFRADTGRALLSHSGSVPIGGPLANARLYVLGEDLALQPIATPGQLYIGGAGLARGYHNQPKMTAERFIDNPHSGIAGDKMYQTGDQVKWLPDGTIEFINRIDNQVKLRGFRIELGEIENRLSDIDGVREAVVLCRDDEGYDKRLVAYIIVTTPLPADDQQVLAAQRQVLGAEYITALKGDLPEYMVPGMFVFMDEYPLTPNGKVNRRALPLPEEADLQKQTYVPARNELEQKLCDIWQQVLGLEQVGIEDSFFALGGHSLLAIRLISLVRQTFDVEVPVKVLFDQSSVAEFVTILPQYGAAEVLESIVKVDRNGELPLSFAQQRLWLVDQLGEGSAQYNMPGAFTLNGKLNVAAFEQAIDAIIKRHEVLRTSFISQQGEARQVIQAAFTLALAYTDLTTLTGETQQAKVAELARIDAAKSFDLTADLLLRVQLLKLGHEQHVVLFNLHHIASDGWSMTVVIREFSELYRAFSQGQVNPLPPLGVQYADYAQWQRHWLSGERLAQQVGYWQQKLAGLPQVHSLALDKPRPVVQSFVGDNHQQLLSSSLTEAVQSLCQRQDVTLFMMLHAALSILLNRYSAQSDIVVGSPVAGRNHQDIEPLIGFFANTLAIRSDLSQNLAFDTYLAQCKQTILDAYSHQDVPFDMVVEALNPQRSLAHGPVVQIVLSLQNNEQVELSLPELTLEGLKGADSAIKFDLELIISESKDGLSLKWAYNVDMFYPETIARMASNFAVLLQSIVATPTKAIHTLDVLSEQEQQTLLVQWNDTERPYPSDASLPELFEQQVERYPDNVALVFGEQQLTYSQLNAKSNQLAHYLIAQGVTADTLVGVCCERSLELLIAILGILKAGGAYMPLDAQYPASRTRFMLSDSQLKLILTQSSLAAMLPETDARLICLDQQWASLLASQSTDNPGVDVCSSHLAYINYTSGSTGQPKGVAIEQKSVIRLVKNTEFIHLDENEVLMQYAPVVFDAATLEIWGSLLNGAKLVIAPPGLLSLEALTAVICDFGVSTVWMTMPLFHQFAQHQLANLGGLNQIVTGADVLNPQLVRDTMAALPTLHLINGYGPTESTTFATTLSIRAADDIGRVVPIGKPITNSQVYLLDQYRGLTPIGAVGEIYIRGEGLARGYLNQPALTRQVFVDNPFGEDPKDRLYKTGDLARLWPDGSMEFIGRADSQVKVRGFRVELGEIESQLSKIDDIKENVVVCQSLPDNQNRLIAYVVSSQPLGDENDAPAQRLARVDQYTECLQHSLPHYMIPAVFVFLPAIPVNSNGKMDRKALPAPQDSDLHRQDYVAPRNDVEQTLCQLWQQILGIKQLGVHEDFFALGGHSLLAIRLISLVRQSMALEVPLRVLFEYPTVAGFAAALPGYNGRVLMPVINVADRTVDLPLSFAQQRLWFIDQLGQGSAQYNMPAAYQVSGAFDVDAAELAISRIISRHEVLRTVYTAQQSGAVQCIEPSFAFTITRHDLQALPEDDRKAQLQGLLNEDAQQPFDLTCDLMLRASFVMLAQGELASGQSQEGVLLFNMHHIASDGWSMNVLVKEFIEQYQAIVGGQPNPLKPLDIQYADFALWQQQWLQGDVLQSQLDYWQQQLADVPMVHSLMLDHPRPQVKQHVGGIVRGHLPSVVATPLQQLAKRHQLTPFMLLHGVLAQVLARHSNNNDIVIGTPVANRVKSELEQLIGFFVNTLVLRVDTSHDELADYFAHVRQVHQDAQSNQDVPFEQLVDKLNVTRSNAHTPLFQVMLITDFARNDSGGDSGGDSGLASESLTLTPLKSDNITAKFDLDINISMNDEGVSIQWTYDTSIFERQHVDQLNQHLCRLLSALVAVDEPKLSELAMLSDQELGQLTGELNDTQSDYAQDLCIHEVFEATVAAVPQQLALACDGQRLTYLALNQRANQLAHRLRAQGVGCETLVGVFVERSVDMMVAILAILKAGGAYLPLDPDYPKARLQYLVEDAGLAHLVAQQPLRSSIGELGLGADVEVCWLDDNTALQQQPTDNLARADGLKPDSLAYVIYTSGSTGQPKGVMVEHRSTVNLATAQGKLFAVDAKSAVLHFASINFDAATWEWVMALLHGASLHICPQAARRDMAVLSQLMQHDAITHATLPPALLPHLDDDRDYALSALIVAGEAVDVQQAERWSQKYPLFNAYGPTENTVCASVGRLTPTQTNHIGRPIDNNQLYVCDAHGRLLPKGAIGELYIGGTGLARGYLNKPDLTEAAFVANPFSQNVGARLYRSGDLVRYLDDDNLQFIGRIDNQIKLRGFRIELGEIESQLSQVAGIEEVAVLCREDQGQQKRLVAYVVPSAVPGADDSVDQPSSLKASLASHCKSSLKGILPEYMIPDSYILLAAMPLTANGKIDSKALPQPTAEDLDKPSYVAPQTQTEQTLCEIWQQVLGVEGVGINDSFFDLGGNSLLITRLLSHIKAKFEFDLALTSVFDEPTVKAVGAMIDLAIAQQQVDALPQDDDMEEIQW